MNVIGDKALENKDFPRHLTDNDRKMIIDCVKRGLPSPWQARAWDKNTVLYYIEVFNNNLIIVRFCQ